MCSRICPVTTKHSRIEKKNSETNQNNHQSHNDTGINEEKEKITENDQIYK